MTFRRKWQHFGYDILRSELSHFKHISQILYAMSWLCQIGLNINEFFFLCSRYMEEIIENTLSLLALHSEQGMSSPGSEKSLEPIHLISLLDIKATWFKKWMVSKVLSKNKQNQNTHAHTHHFLNEYFWILTLLSSKKRNMSWIYLELIFHIIIITLASTPVDDKVLFIVSTHLIYVLWI